MIRLTLRHGFIWVKPEAIESVRGWGSGSEICFHSSAFTIIESAERVAEMIEEALRSGATAPMRPGSQQGGG